MTRRNAAALIKFLCICTSMEFGVQRAAASDAIARSVIFAEQHVDDSALHLRRASRQLPPDTRFEFLASWVLPGPQHPTLRTNVSFTPTDPAPPVAAAFGINVPDGGRRVASGGELISPVLDLIALAVQRNQVESLRERVEAWMPVSPGDRQRQSALLTLLAIAEGNLSLAAGRLDELLEATTGHRTGAADSAAASVRGQPDPPAPSDAVLLVLDQGLHHKELHEHLSELLAVYRRWILSDFSRPVPHRHLAGILNRLHQASFGTEDNRVPLVSVRSEPPDHWASVSRATAQTRGSGQPAADWFWRPGLVTNVSSHDDDYLYFSTPLRGDFEIEGDVSGFQWRDSHLMTAGQWVAPVYTHKDFDSGYFSRQLARRPLATPLTKTRDWIHYRTAVRSGRVTTWFNGRQVCSEPVSERHDPWLAIRSTPRHDGSVRSLQITGSPIIPEELNLTADTHPGHWLDYSQPPGAPSQGLLWDLQEGADGTHTITGRRSAWSTPPDTSPGYDERLLRYHRPMLEDGAIEYEFYYSPSAVLAHPALDRTVFLLSPEGVSLHWLTDGRWDRTGLPPDNLTVDSAHRRSEALPLMPDQWNHLRLEVTGDHVSLRLNDRLVYRHRLASTNQRTIGLFYYADRTSLRVRNIRWKGRWPKSLTSPDQQSLFPPLPDVLDDTRHLTQEFHHDFATDGLPPEQFVLIQGTPGEHIIASRSGVRASRTGTGTYRNATIAPAVTIHGDFDIRAMYADFSAAPIATGHGTIAVIAFFDATDVEEASVMQRHLHRQDGTHENLCDCGLVQRINGQSRRSYFGREPMDQTAGTLRLVRKGGRIWFLTAEEDSDQFQLRAEREVSRAPVRLEGLRLMTQIHQAGGHAGVTWTGLSIRAEKLTGPAVDSVSSPVAELNRQRDALPSRFDHDFTSTPPEPEDFSLWNTDGDWSPDSDGWVLTARGQEQWTSAGAALNRRISGDFDVSIKVDIRSFPVPTPGHRASFYLQAALPDTDRTQASIIFSRNASGEHEVIAQVREPQNGGFTYRPLGVISAPSISELRIARRGPRLTMLARTADGSVERLVGFVERPAVPLEPEAIKFFAHHGDTGMSTRVAVHSLEISADEFPADTAAALPARLKTQSQPSF